jgi:hypothetical protein
MLFGALQPSAGSAHLQSQPAEGVTFLGLTLRFVECFASHPPQRMQKDGAPSWLAELKAGPPPRAKIRLNRNSNRGGQGCPPYARRS